MLLQLLLHKVRLSHVIPHHVALMLHATTVSVRVCPIIVEIRMSHVDQSVLEVKNVPGTKLALETNVAIPALGFVDKMQNVTSSIIYQHVHVCLILLAIRSQTAIE